MFKKGLLISIAPVIALCAILLCITVLAAPLAGSEVAGHTTLWTDDFNSPVLNERWAWQFEDPAFWSLTDRPGFLRITTQPTLSNILLQTPPAGDYTIETHLFITPTENFQQGGLILWKEPGTALALIRAYCDLPQPICVGNGIYFDHVEGGMLIGSNFPMTITTTSETYLRMVRVGAVYSGYVSVDNAVWQFVGAHTAGFDPAGIGLRSGNNFSGGSPIPSDYDYVAIWSDYPDHLFVPVVLNQ